jgi:hypothetical protein
VRLDSMFDQLSSDLLARYRSALCTPWVLWTCTVTPLCTTATITGPHEQQQQHSRSTDASQCRFEIYTRNIEWSRKTAFHVWCRLQAELPGRYY